MTTPLPMEVCPARAKARELAAAMLAGRPDPMAEEWATMRKDERELWLRLSRLDAGHAGRIWSAIPGHERAVIRNNLYRAATRASKLLHLA